MKIDLCASEIWDLLKEGSTNQKDFVEDLYYSEFVEFIEFIEYYNDEFDILGYLNGGVLHVEEDPAEDDYIIWSNDRITVVFIC